MPFTPYDAEIEALIESKKPNGGLGQGLPAFIRYISPLLEDTPHTSRLVEALERTTKEPVRLCVSMPPRHGKTVTIMHAIAYFLKEDPSKTHVYMSYGSSLAESKSRQIRRYAAEAGVDLAKGSKSVKEWRTPLGGGLVATSMMGALTGVGVNGVLVIDDPLKNREEAESPATRNKVWEAFTDVAFTRLEDRASCLVVLTRWHADDIIGRLMRDHRDTWEYINLPAIDDKGAALWPAKYPIAKLNAIRGQMGDYSFESLYQGAPRPRGFNVFKDPMRYKAPIKRNEIAEFVKGKHLILGVDPAASTKNRADYSVILLLAKDSLGHSGHAWVIDVVRKQLTVPDLVDLIAEKREKYGCPIVVESVGGFKAIPQMLRRIDTSLSQRGQLVEVHPSLDKFTRAQPVAAAWNSGRVFVPLNTRWADIFIDEVAAFTGKGDAHDDQVDALAHAWDALSSLKQVYRGVRFARGPFG